MSRDDDAPTPARSDLASRQLEELVERYADRVRRAAARYQLAAGDVDEIFQEVRIRLWRAFEGRGNVADAPASYVYRTAITAAIDLIRRRQTRREEQLDPDQRERGPLFGHTNTPSEQLDDDELARQVEHEIARLPADRQLAVRMHLSGYPREEIATIMRWSEARTRHLIYRGLGQLRRLLRSAGVSPEDRQ